MLSSNLGNSPEGIAYDGFSLWTANAFGSVSRVNILTGHANNVTTGFSSPRGILYDGNNIWVTDSGDDSLKKLDGDGNILQSVPVGDGPRYPVYDGVNIWVPNQISNTITVVRALTGQVVATIHTIALVDEPLSVAFDGERILVVGNTGAAAMYKAADLTLIKVRNVSQGFGTCSDGIKFFFTAPGLDRLIAF